MSFGRICWQLLLAGLLFSGAAYAQQPVTPQIQALQQTVVELTGQKLDWQTQALTLQRRVDDLANQIAEMKKPVVPEAPKP